MVLMVSQVSNWVTMILSEILSIRRNTYRLLMIASWTWGRGTEISMFGDLFHSKYFNTLYITEFTTGRMVVDRLASERWWLLVTSMLRNGRWRCGWEAMRIITMSCLASWSAACSSSPRYCHYFHHLVAFFFGVGIEETLDLEWVSVQMPMWVKEM